MLSLKHINKYYYKDTPREIHVINDVSLEFPDSGFISILGPSGSGKSTLLNVIGGLDSFHDGSITYFDKTFIGYHSKEVDKIRRDRIGYIFQNYLLDEEETVYDNLKNALDISSITKEKEQFLRIDYALKSVGLEKYKKKLAKNLSGGQMQRVAIARVLVKDVDIILADEPTGNIDSENTIWILNILKQISRTKLVILVTHEEPMAQYYSDKIIHIKDGIITSYEDNTESSSIKIKNDRVIHLLDYKKEEYKTDLFKQNIYYDDSTKDLSLDLIIKNNTVYIKSNKLIVSLDSSSIDVVNDHEKSIKKEDINVFNFDQSFYDNTKSKEPFFKRILNFFKTGFKSYFNSKKTSKIFQAVFLILGGIMSFCVINLIDFNTVDLSNCIKSDDYYVIYNEDESSLHLDYPYNDKEILFDLLDNNKVSQINLISSSYMQSSYRPNHIMKLNRNDQVYLQIYSSTYDILVGTTPSTDTCVIGKRLALDILEEFNLGTNLNNILKCDIYIDYSTKIVGVVDVDSYYAYVSPFSFYNSGYVVSASILSTNRQNVLDEESTPHYQIIDGSDLLNNNQIIVNKNYLEQRELDNSDLLGKTVTFKKSDTEDINYTIVGIFETDCHILDFDYIFLDNQLYDGYLTYNSNNNTCEINNYIEYSSTYYSYGYVPLNVLTDEYRLLSGRLPAAEDEVIISAHLNIPLDTIINGNLKVVGTFVYDQNKLSSKDLSLDYYGITTLKYYLANSNQGICIIPNSETQSYVSEKGYTLESLKSYQTRQYTEYQQSINSSVLVTVIFLVLTFIVYSYFSNRSKMISDIYGIGMDRALGKSKKKILSKYISFSIIQTTFSCVLGYLIVFIGYYLLKTKYASIFGVYESKPLYILLGILGMYVLNTLFGILPIIFLNHKTTSEIIAKYDI